MLGFSKTGIGCQQESSMNLDLALSSVLHFNEFWTHQSSLTSLACHESMRWFVAMQIPSAGIKQMQAASDASTYSAPAQQEVSQHRIHE